MKKLLVLFFVAAMCIPSYGVVVDTNVILVYATTTTATVFDFTAKTRNVETEKGFLVLDVNFPSQTVRAAKHVTYSGTSQQTAVVDVNLHDGNVPGYIVVEYESDDYYAELYGTDPNTDIGLKDGSGLYGKPSMKKHVATTLGGHLVVEASNCYGSGIVSATLDSVRTKGANRGDGNSITTVVAGIVTYLGGSRYYSSSYIQTQIDNAIAGRDSNEPVTVTIPAGTFVESLDISEPNVTLKSKSGKATTFIAPGAGGRGVIKISGERVTIDGFTIRHGTQDYNAANPVEHTIWVDANYSTIKNCTIIGAGGNQACILIGGRTASIPSGNVGTALWGYNVAKSKGHTIQNNTFRYRQSGEGWGIFAVKLSDDCNIRGNTFDGDATDHDAWGANEGAPGTGIIIHRADKGDGNNAVIIRNNTAKYIKYSWLSFSAKYPYNDTTGYMYEQPNNCTVADVIVAYNTVHDLGKEDWMHLDGVAIKFMGEDKDDAYDPNVGDLTIGAGKVTIKNNTFYNNQCGVEISGPTSYDDANYGCVLLAENITIDPNNSIYSNSSYGVYNGTVDDDQEGGHKTIDAAYNWWGVASGPYYYKSHTEGRGNQVTDHVTFAPHRTTVPR